MNLKRINRAYYSPIIKTAYTPEQARNEGFTLRLTSLSIPQRIEHAIDPNKIFIGSLWDDATLEGHLCQWAGNCFVLIGSPITGNTNV